MMSSGIGQWVAFWAAQWSDLSVSIKYYHKPIHHTNGMTFTCSQLRPYLSAHDALFGLCSADRTQISLSGDLRATAGPYGHTMPLQAGY